MERVARGKPSGDAIVRSLAAAALACASGCATVMLPSPQDAERARTAATYSGSIRVSIDGPEYRGRARALVAFRRPDALRIEIPGPTGVRLIVVVHDDALTAVLPLERAVFSGAAAERDLDALLGVSLDPREVMDLLVGVPSPRLRRWNARWSRALPKRLDAWLEGGTRLSIKVDEAEVGVSLPAAAFTDPPHAGYRPVSAEEARRLLGI